MRGTRALRVLALAGLLLAAGSGARAIINPDFTPIELVGDSKLILHLAPRAGAKGGPAAKGGALAFRVVACLKGKAPAQAPSVDLAAAVEKSHAEFLRRIAAAVGEGPALLFVGEYPPETNMGGGEMGEAPADGPVNVGYLHIGGRWFRLDEAPGNAWKLRAISTWMEATWAGGSDMLLRAVSYVLTDHNPDVPVNSGTGWRDPVKLGALKGKVHALQAVELAAPAAPAGGPAGGAPGGRRRELQGAIGKPDRASSAGDADAGISDAGERTRPMPAPARGPAAPAGGLVLFAAAEAGDRLWKYDAAGKSFKDVTADRKLASRSKAAAWGDLDADGRMDLASWDGGKLTLWTQAADGTFTASEPKLDKPLPEAVLGLAVLGAGKGPALLVSSAGEAILLKRTGGAWTSAPLPFPKDKELPDIGARAPCLVADLDGDAIADVLQPGARGSFLYRGKGRGAFEPAAVSPVGLGRGRAGACIADFDMDGRLDVFTAAEDGCRIWQNLGKNSFGEALGFSGEIRYIAKPQAIAVQACEVNNDGRQDAFILYQGRTPHIFFNRGFRSFGHAHRLDLNEQRMIPEAANGQQAGLVADLDASGAQDMVLALENGEVWFVPNDLEPDAALGARVVLPPGAGAAGPVTVTAWQEKRCLGAWSVAAGAPGAFFGSLDPGEILVRWRFPGQDKPREKKVVFDDRLVRVPITPKD